MEIIKRIIDKLPFPIIVALSILMLLVWGLKQYYGWQNYRGLIENKIFLVVCIVIMFTLPLYYVISYIISKLSSDTFTIAIANFVGDEVLGANIADEMEESLRCLCGKVKGIKLLEGQVKNSINGEKEAVEIASKLNAHLLIWGKIIDYNGQTKVIPRIFLAKKVVSS